MPRLDNSDPKIQEWAIENIEDFDFKPEYNLDPGRIPPIDVCYQCWHALGKPDDCDHPPYDDEDFFCAVCGELLDRWDDE